MNKLLHVVCAVGLLCSSISYSMEDTVQVDEGLFDPNHIVVCTQLSLNNFKRTLSPEDNEALDKMLDSAERTDLSNGVISFKGILFKQSRDYSLLSELQIKQYELGFSNHVYLGRVNHEDFATFTRWCLSDKGKKIFADGNASDDIKNEKFRLERENPRAPLHQALFVAVSYAHKVAQEKDQEPFSFYDKDALNEALHSMGLSYDEHKAEIEAIKTEVWKSETDTSRSVNLEYRAMISAADTARKGQLGDGSIFNEEFIEQLNEEHWEKVPEDMKRDLEKMDEEQRILDVFIDPQVYQTYPDFFDSIPEMYIAFATRHTFRNNCSDFFERESNYLYGPQCSVNILLDSRVAALLDGSKNLGAMLPFEIAKDIVSMAGLAEIRVKDILKRHEKNPEKLEAVTQLFAKAKREHSFTSYNNLTGEEILNGALTDEQVVHYTQNQKATHGKLVPYHKHNYSLQSEWDKWMEYISPYIQHGFLKIDESEGVERNYIIPDELYEERSQTLSPEVDMFFYDVPLAPRIYLSDTDGYYNNYVRTEEFLSSPVSSYFKPVNDSATIATAMALLGYGDGTAFQAAPEYEYQSCSAKSLINPYVGNLTVPTKLVDTFKEWVEPLGGYFIPNDNGISKLAFLGSYPEDVKTHQALFEAAAQIASRLDSTKDINTLQACRFDNKALADFFDSSLIDRKQHFAVD